MSKLGDKLNFNSMKSSAMDTRSISSVIPPRSGVEFQAGTVIEFELPGNRGNEFLDLNNNLKFKLPVTTTAHASVLDRCGAYGFINKLEYIQNGVVLCSIPKYNVLLTALSDLQMSAEYKSTTGRMLEGFEGDCLRGAHLPIGSRTFYLSPLASDLSMTNRSLYLGTNANITVRLTLESAAVAFQSAGADYSVKQPQMLMETTFLERETMDALSKAVGGEYKMLCNSYDHMSAVINAGTTASHIKLSFQKASLERVLFTVRPLSHTTSAGKFSLGSRGTGNLSSFQLEIGGVDYPQTAISVGEDSMYHVLKADNIASNYTHGLSGLMNAYTADAHADGSGTSSLGGEPQVSKINPYILSGADGDGDNFGKGKNGTASASSNIGTFVGAVNLESSLTTSQNSPLYSGVNTKNGVDIYFKANWGAGCIVGGVVVDFYSLSTELIYVDPSINMWSRKN